MFWLILLVSILSLVFPSGVSASINPKISYQGKLTDLNGRAVADGNYDMEFVFYDAVTAGNCVWTARGSCVTPTARSVAVSNGVFSILLGDTGDDSLAAIDFDQQLWIGITIASDSEMTPRREMGAVAAAFNADKLDGLDTSDSGGTGAFVPVTTSGGNLVLTGNPTGTGVGGGSLYINPASADANEKLFGVALNGSERFWVDEDGDGYFAGYVGIGITNPTSLLYVGSAGTPGSIDGTDDLYVYDDLEVDGTIYGDGSGISGVTASPGGTDGQIQYNNGGLMGGANIFYWDDVSSYVGIGTTNPTDLLTISGDDAPDVHHYAYSSAGATSKGDYEFRRARGTEASPLVVADGDWLGNFRFIAYDGTDFDTVGANIAAIIDGTPGADDIPTRLEFGTTADGDNSTTVRMIIKSDGSVGIGTTDPEVGLLTMVGNNLDVFHDSYSSNGAGYKSDYEFRRARGTEASPLVVADGDWLGNIRFKGHSGSSFEHGAYIGAIVAGTPGSGDMPTRLEFGTSADGSGSPTAHLTIREDGNIGIGTTNPLYNQLVISSNQPNSSDHNWMTFYNTASGYGDWTLLKSGTNDLTIGYDTSSGSSPNKVVTFQYGGDVGIGTTNPGGYKLWVSGSTAGMRTTATTGWGLLAESTSNYSIYVGASSSTYDLYVSGSGYATGSFVDGSDVRFKKNIVDIDNALDKIVQLRGVYYDWRVDEFPDKGFDPGRNIGLIAQEVEPVIPEVVMTNDQDGYKGVSYGRLTALAIAAIKEQQLQIEALSGSIEGLDVAYWSLSEDGTTLSTPLNIVANEVSGTTGVFSLLNAEALRIGDDKFVVDSFGNVDVVGDLVLAGVLSGRYGDLSVRLGDSLGSNVFAIQNVLGESVFEVDSEGDMQVKGKISITEGAGDASVGTGVIVIGETEVVIVTSAALEGSRVFVTPRIEQGAIPSLAVKKVENGRFEIRLEQPVDQQIEFDWWVIN